MTRSVLLSAMLTLAFLLPKPTAGQVTLLDTFGPSDAFHATFNYTILNANDPEFGPFHQFIAVPFTVSQAGLELTNIDLGLSSNGTPGAFQLSVAGDASGLPGADLVTLTHSTPITSTPAVISFSPTATLALTQGNTYWVVARTEEIAFFDGYSWHFNTTAAQGVADEGGSGWNWSAIDESPVARVEADTPLPVELSSLNVTINGTDAQLDWETQSETGNSGFEVQHRATDEFLAVGFVEGMGTSAEPQRYSFSIANLTPGFHSFRLKQIDIDGSWALTETIVAYVNPVGPIGLSVYPNPSAGRAEVRAVLSIPEKHVEIDVYDALGRHIRRLYSGASTDAHIAADLTQLPAGLYFVRAISESATASRALVVR